MTEGWIPAFAGMTKKGTGMTDEDFTPTLILPPQGEKQYRVYSIEYIVRKKQRKRWIPACAGITEKESGSDKSDPYKGLKTVN